uniref:Uncharacterized protein n=1 Tax=Anguilla anguilla TaxID=7936 RepID=A0A0E9XTT6_ANGAN
MFIQRVKNILNTCTNMDMRKHLFVYISIPLPMLKHKSFCNDIPFHIFIQHRIYRFALSSSAISAR